MKYKITQAKAVLVNGKLQGIAHAKETDDIEAYRAQLLETARQANPMVQFINFTYEYGSTGEH